MNHARTGSLVGMLMCFAGLSACGEPGPTQPAEIAGEQVQAAPADGVAGYDPARLRELTPHAPGRYLAWLPGEIAGLPMNGAVNIEGGNGVSASYQGEQDPSRRIALDLIDGAGDRGMAHLNVIHRMISLDIDESSGGVVARTIERDGVRYLGKERARSGGTDAELEWIRDGRYHLKLTGTGIGLESLLEAAAALDTRPI